MAFAAMRHAPIPMCFVVAERREGSQRDVARNCGRNISGDVRAGPTTGRNAAKLRQTVGPRLSTVRGVPLGTVLALTLCGIADANSLVLCRMADANSIEQSALRSVRSLSHRELNREGSSSAVWYASFSAMVLFG
jgi:hypothetical protein